MKNAFGEEIPDKLYKYMPCNNAFDSIDGEPNYVKDLIEKKELFFQSPTDFNDPFDCDLNIKSTWKEKIKFLKQCIHRIIKELFKEQKICLMIVFVFFELCPDRFFSWIIKKLFTKEKFAKEFDKCLFEFESSLKKRLKICCFTEDNINVLMWSHYAQKHTGVCLEFDSSKLSDIIRIHYNDNLLDINFKTIKRKFDFKDNMFISQKAKLWAYEKEYRMFKIDNIEGESKDKDISKNLYSFNDKALTGIICGCAMRDEVFQSIIAYLSQQSIPIKVYKVEKKKYSFGLDLNYIGQYGGENFLNKTTICNVLE